MRQEMTNALLEISYNQHATVAAHCTTIHRNSIKPISNRNSKYWKTIENFLKTSKLILQMDPFDDFFDGVLIGKGEHDGGSGGREQL